MQKDGATIAAGTMDVALARKFAKLAQEIDLADIRLKYLKGEKAKLTEPLLAQMVTNGVQNFPVTAGGQRMTIYVNRLVRIKAKKDSDGNPDRAAVSSALKHCGLSSFVAESWNNAKLAAYIRERLGEGKQIQPTLDAVLEVWEDVEVRAVRSTKSETKSERAARTLRKKKTTKTTPIDTPT